MRSVDEINAEVAEALAAMVSRPAHMPRWRVWQLPCADCGRPHEWSEDKQALHVVHREDCAYVRYLEAIHLAVDEIERASATL